MRACAWAIGALLIAPLQAQFGALVTTGNGADLYLSSTLPLKGSGQPSQGRIYEVGSAPLKAVAAVTPIGPANPCIGVLCISNFFDLSQPDVSRDGTVLAYVGTAQCVGHCVSAGDLHQTTVRGMPGLSDRVFSGRARLSGNGRYLAGSQISYYTNSTQFYRVDLSTGKETSFAAVHGADYHNGFPFSGRSVADSGDFVAFVGGRLNIFREGQWNPIPVAADAPNFVTASIDSAGHTVVYQVCCTPYSSYLRVFRPLTGQDAVLFRGEGSASSPKITADGKRVAFLATSGPGTPGDPGLAQVYVADVDGTAARVVTSDPDGIVNFALADDGQTVWYLNGTGALYQLSAATGQARERIPSTCTAAVYDDISPGSAAFFDGSCLGRDFKATFDGVPGPFLARTGRGIWVQVPWAVQASKTVAVSLESESPFGPALNTAVHAALTVPRFTSVAIHQDWTGYVNTSRPARPNEIIHLYATGLGPVQPSVETGVPAPNSPPARIVAPFDCNVPVVFAGLAPGLVGFYQVSLRMPESGNDILAVSCTGGAFTAFAFQP